MRSCLDAATGASNRLELPPVDRAVVVLVDGLGAEPLRERTGHARTLAPAMATRADVVTTGVPTTTAAAIATLTTGVPPGEHGIVGYAALDPEHDRVVNQLRGWDAGMQPAVWQPVPTLFEQADGRGLDAVVIGAPQYRDSGYTQAVLRGARYLDGRRPADRAAVLTELLADASWRGIVYLYVPELDQAAHQHGWRSGEWTTALETADAAIASMLPAVTATQVRARTGLVVTADHGMVDVPAHGHVVLEPGSELLRGVRHVAGEPRMLHLHTEDGTAEAITDLANRWRASEASRSWIATRDEAIDAGWFGTVRPEVVARIGEVLVAPRSLVAYATAEQEAAGAGSMIGQHGSWTPEETRVPLLRFGAFRR
jgi:hypothetical protein